MTSEGINTGWQKIASFAAGWSSDPASPAEIRRERNIVSMRGSLITSPGWQPTAITVLPVIFRPQTRQGFICTNGKVWDAQATSCYAVDADGTLSGGSGGMLLNAIRYPTD